jgi:hypothetical protein
LRTTTELIKIFALLHLMLDEDEYLLRPEQELSADLARLGYTLADIRR